MMVPSVSEQVPVPNAEAAPATNVNTGYGERLQRSRWQRRCRARMKDRLELISGRQTALAA
jgi:hypothetical protein